VVRRLVYFNRVIYNLLVYHKTLPVLGSRDSRSCTGGGYEQTGRNSSKENQSQDPRKLIFQLCRQRLFLEIIHSKVVENIKSIKVAC
jgi:hypothetical protein